MTPENLAFNLACMSGARSRLVEILSNPLLALVVALLAIAIGLSGRFSVSTSEIVFGLGLIVFVIFLFSLKLSWAQTVISMVVAAVIFFLMAAWFRPEVVPQDFGVLIPQRKLLFYPSGTATKAIIQIGDSATSLVWGGEAGGPIFVFLTDDKLVVERIGNRVKVSTVFRDEKGDVIAELKRSEWKVAPPPNTWDRNYTADALEVKDARGKVILQVRAMPDRIQLQGIWRGPNGSFFALFKNQFGTGSIQVVAPGQRPPGGEPILQPLFEYPSAAHFGELIR